MYNLYLLQLLYYLATPPEIARPSVKGNCGMNTTLNYRFP